jgi:hypothetical protein
VEWLDLVVGDAPLDSRARDVLGRTPSEVERAALRAARGHVLALRSLSRVATPASLEGLVVASLEAGHRQDRAVSLVESLEGKPAPVELDELVEGSVEVRGEGLRAPHVLDRLVGERVADPEGAMVRSMADRLERLHAPDVLDERVRENGGFTPSGRTVRGALLRVAGGAVLAAALILAVRLFDGTPDPAEQGPTLTIVRYESLEDAGMSDADRTLFSSMTGEVFGGRS